MSCNSFLKVQLISLFVGIIFFKNGLLSEIDLSRYGCLLFCHIFISIFSEPF